MDIIACNKEMAACLPRVSRMSNTGDNIVFFFFSTCAVSVALTWPGGNPLVVNAQVFLRKKIFADR